MNSRRKTRLVCIDSWLDAAGNPRPWLKPLKSHSPSATLTTMDIDSFLRWPVALISCDSV